MSLRDVLNDERHDLDGVENPLVEVLPRSIRAIAGAEMQAFGTDHLEQTKGQVFGCARRLSTWGEKPAGEHRSGIEGSIKDASEALSKGHPLSYGLFLLPLLEHPGDGDCGALSGDLVMLHAQRHAENPGIQSEGL